jgi:hypothetical protein
MRQMAQGIHKPKKVEETHLQDKYFIFKKGIQKFIFLCQNLSFLFESSSLVKNYVWAKQNICKTR